jgi:hypothetical protein
MKILTLKAVENLEARAHKLAAASAPKCPKCHRKMIQCSRSMIMHRRYTKRMWEKSQETIKKLWRTHHMGPWKKQPYVRREPEVNFVCRGCKGDIVRRPMTEAEIDLYFAHDKARDARSSAMFKPWHAFQKKFAGADPKASHTGTTWKFQGYDFIKKIEKHVEKVPTMEVVRCDDGHHAGSRILVVHHELPDYYWGTSFLYVPQCTGEPPVEFFFYENHAQGFLAVMKKIAAKHRGKGDRP